MLPQVKRLQDEYYLAALRNFRKPGCLWSKGIGEYCDFHGPDSYRLAETESCQPEEFFRQHYAGAHGLVWVRLSTRARDGKECDLDKFVSAALPTIRRPFALITTDGDASVPSELSRNTVSVLLDNPYLVSWHTQNHDGHPHPKLKPIPIGLDFHTPRPDTTPVGLHEQLCSIRRNRRPAQELPLRVFCDFRDTPERREVLATLRNCDHIDFLSSRLSQADIWERYAQYPFVVSAKSNGLDCHRTWELLYLGCIVITQTSSLDPLFSGLPVVVVRDWSEVRQPGSLAKWLAQFGKLTDQAHVWKRLEPNRLLQPIRTALDAASAQRYPAHAMKSDEVSTSARFLHFSPITPARHGNGLAMRASLFAEALAQMGRVDVAVIGSPLPEGEGWRPNNVTVHHIVTEGRLDTRLRLISRIPNLSERLAALRAFGRPMSTMSLSAPVVGDASRIAGSAPYAAILLSRAHLLPLLDALPRPLPPVIVDLDDDDAVLFREWSALKSESGDQQGAAWLEAQADLLDSLIVRSKSKVSAFACASDTVAQTLASRLSLQNVAVIPNGVDTSPMNRKAALSTTMIFVGNLSYEPNVDGVIWFCRSVFPLVRDTVADARLIVAGSRPTEAVRQACAGPGIALHADVQDSAPLYRQASLCVVPLRSGSGSRIKILEAAVHGLPVASTGKGAQGLSAEIQDALFVGSEDPAEFARICVGCLGNPNSALLRAGELQALVVRHHGRAAIMSRIQELIGGFPSPL